MTTTEGFTNALLTFSALLPHAANRARRQAMEELDRGDLRAAENTLSHVCYSMAVLRPTERTTRELDLLRQKKSLLRSDCNRARKGLSRESLRSLLHVWGNDDDNL